MKFSFSCNLPELFCLSATSKLLKFPESPGFICRSVSSIIFFTKSQTYTPIAGALVSPGDSIPATSINPGTSVNSSIWKSPPSSCARSPANDVMTWRVGMPCTDFAESFNTLSSPALVVALSSLSGTSSAVGPIIRLPCMVGVTRTPFPISPGT